MHQLYNAIAHAVCFIRRLALSWKYRCWLRETADACFSTLLHSLIPPSIFSHLSCSFLRPLILRFFLPPSLLSKPYHPAVYFLPLTTLLVPLMLLSTPKCRLPFHPNICFLPSLVPLFVSLLLQPPVWFAFVAFSFHSFFLSRLIKWPLALATACTSVAQW